MADIHHALRAGASLLRYADSGADDAATARATGQRIIERAIGELGQVVRSTPGRRLTGGPGDAARLALADARGLPVPRAALGAVRRSHPRSALGSVRRPAPAAAGREPLPEPLRRCCRDHWHGDVERVMTALGNDALALLHEAEARGGDPARELAMWLHAMRLLLADAAEVAVVFFDSRPQI